MSTLRFRLARFLRRWLFIAPADVLHRLGGEQDNWLHSCAAYWVNSTPMHWTWLLMPKAPRGTTVIHWNVQTGNWSSWL